VLLAYVDVHVDCPWHAEKLIHEETNSIIVIVWDFIFELFLFDLGSKCFLLSN